MEGLKSVFDLTLRERSEHYRKVANIRPGLIFENNYFQLEVALYSVGLIFERNYFEHSALINNVMLFYIIVIAGMAFKKVHQNRSTKVETHVFLQKCKLTHVT